MADRLTQLQDCLDDLLMQMFATLNYIQTHHPFGELPGQPDQAPSATETANAEGGSRSILNGDAHRKHSEADKSGTGNAGTAEPLTPVPDTVDVFNNALRELARDLVIQEQKAELLINSLPGIQNGERHQRQRMQELEAELKEVGMLRSRAEEQKSHMLNDLDQFIVGLRRVR